MVIKWIVSVMGNHNRRALWNKKLSLRTIPQRHFEAKFCIVSAKYFAIFPFFTLVKGWIELIQCGSGCEKRCRKHWMQIECSASVEELDGCSVEGNECGVVLVFTLIRLQWYLGAYTRRAVTKGWIDTGKCCGGAVRTVGANVVRRGWLSVISDCCRYRERRMARGGSALVNWRTSPAHSWRKQYVPCVNFARIWRSSWLQLHFQLHLLRCILSVGLHL